MKLGGMFGVNKPKTLASVPKAPVVTKAAGELEKVMAKRYDPSNPFAHVVWTKQPTQKVKDYKAITTKEELIEYCKRCEDTGLVGFDYETAGDEKHRVPPVDGDGNELEGKERDKWLLQVNLDPWRSDICTVSLSAAANESRVIPISHKKGKIFEPELSRSEARKVVMDILDMYLFAKDNIVKIAVNLGFETKHTAKHGKYIQKPVADPLIMWVRGMQVIAPQKIKVPKKPFSGWGLKNATKAFLGVQQQEFTEVLNKHNATFFDEVAADSGDGLVYSAEDADYAVQLYLYWLEIIKQIPGYEKWLSEIEMPFQRVIGLMEYWGMNWDTDLADMKAEEAINMQQAASEEISKIGLQLFNEKIDPGKSGKTAAVKHLLFELMKLPAAKWGKTGPSLDNEALINMKFMLENKLVAIEEEKYLHVKLPEGWENMDVDAEYGEPGFEPNLSKDERAAIRIQRRSYHEYKDAGLRLIELLGDIQKYSTLLSSHIEGRAKHRNPVSGRIHAGYGVWTETSRANSFNPNGQNVPRVDNDVFGIRNFYKAPEGKVLFLIDFSGFELRIMAWRANDATMIELFNTGGDMHKRTAMTLTGKTNPDDITKVERTSAKAGNFGISYGGTEHALQSVFLTDYNQRRTLDECLDIVNAVKNTYPGIPQFQRDIELDAREKGYVTTAYGYMRMLPHINSSERYLRQSAARQAANTPIQGSAADFMKRSQNDVYDQIGRDTRAVYLGEKSFDEVIFCHGKTDMIAQIHDEIIFELDDEPGVVERVSRTVQALMERAPLKDFPVPVEAEGSVAYSWGKKQDVADWLKEKGL